MKGHQACGIYKISEQRGDIAVAHKNFRMGLDLLQVQGFEQIVRTVAAARTNNRPHVLARKHFFQFTRPALHRARKVKILLKNGIKIKRPIARAPQPLTASFQIGALDVARRRHDTNRISRPKGRRPDTGSSGRSHAARRLF